MKSQNNKAYIIPNGHVLSTNEVLSNRTRLQKFELLPEGTGMVIPKQPSLSPRLLVVLNKQKSHLLKTTHTWRT